MVEVEAVDALGSAQDFPDDWSLLEGSEDDGFSSTKCMHLVWVVVCMSSCLHVVCARAPHRLELLLNGKRLCAVCGSWCSEVLDLSQDESLCRADVAPAGKTQAAPLHAVPHPPSSGCEAPALPSSGHGSGPVSFLAALTSQGNATRSPSDSEASSGGLPGHGDGQGLVWVPVSVAPPNTSKKVGKIEEERGALDGWCQEDGADTRALRGRRRAVSGKRR